MQLVLDLSGMKLLELLFENIWFLAEYRAHKDKISSRADRDFMSPLYVYFSVMSLFLFWRHFVNVRVSSELHLDLVAL